MPEHVILVLPYERALADDSALWLTTQGHNFANKTELISLQEVALAHFEQHTTPAKPWGWVTGVRHTGPFPKKPSAGSKTSLTHVP